MPGVTKEQIVLARQVDVLDYVLRNEADNVQRIGSGYRLKDHPSLAVNSGVWYWHSQEFGGKTALDYLTNVRGYGLVEAVCRLLSEKPSERSVRPNAQSPTQPATPKAKPSTEHIPFSLPVRHKDNNRVIAYLQSRGIDKALILDCIDRGALYESKLFNLLCDKADNEYGGRLPIHVRFLLDEFANIGQIPKFDKLIATIRSREISACVILQAQSQLKALYKDNAETIVGNMDTRLFLGGSEKTTLKDLTESLGKETIYLLNHSESKGNSPSYSQNQQKLGKELMSMDELSVMDGSKCILQLRGVRPFLSDKFDIMQHKNYRYLSDANPKNAFDIGKFVSTKLKVKPDEQYEYFEYAPPDEEVPDEAFEDFPPDLEPV